MAGAAPPTRRHRVFQKGFGMSEQHATVTAVDLSDFDAGERDDVKIGRGVYVPCRICQEMFSRIRLTQMYCDTCKMGVCSGEHGQWTDGGKHVLCVRHQQSRSMS
jgi:hypothetical protein